MPGVVFLIVIPTANYEQTLPDPLLFGRCPPTVASKPQNNDPTDPRTATAPATHQQPTAMRLEVELRAKNSGAAHQPFRQAAPLRRPHIGGAAIIDGPPPPTYEQQQQQHGSGGSSLENVRDL